MTSAFRNLEGIFEAAFELVEEVIVERPFLWMITATSVQRNFQLNQQMEN